MSTLSLRLPDSLHRRVRIVSHKDRVSINQFVATAVAEKIAALDTEDYIGARGKRATRKKFVAALAKVPNVAPAEFDRR
ncbi:MAG: toxin-antitoxin system HicB family antitoxin [Planctomycetota bacterium]